MGYHKDFIILIERQRANILDQCLLKIRLKGINSISRVELSDGLQWALDTAGDIEPPSCDYPKRYFYTAFKANFPLWLAAKKNNKAIKC